jgi:hypothetical protein
MGKRGRGREGRGVSWGSERGVTDTVTSERGRDAEGEEVIKK